MAQQPDLGFPFPLTPLSCQSNGTPQSLYPGAVPLEHTGSPQPGGLGRCLAFSKSLIYVERKQFLKKKKSQSKTSHQDREEKKGLKKKIP